MGLKKKFHDGLRWVGSRTGARGAVLLYHRVDEPSRDPFGLCVSPVRFEEQMRVLAERGCALSLDEFLGRQRIGALERGSVCVTFDDGYDDVFRNAIPILEKYGIPATVFVATGNLGRAFWWDRLHSLVADAHRLPARLRLEESRNSVVNVGDCSRAEAYERTYRILRTAEPSRREELIESISTQLGDGVQSEIPRAATSEELREAAGHHLVTLQAHTVSHSRLSALSYGDQVEEIERSASCVAEVTGRPVKAVSYPFGLRGRDYDANTLRAVSDAGLDYGFTADLDVVTRRTSMLEIPRLWVHDRGPRYFRGRLRFWLGGSREKPRAIER